MTSGGTSRAAQRDERAAADSNTRPYDANNQTSNVGAGIERENESTHHGAGDCPRIAES